MAQLAVNNSINTSSQHTLFFAMFGHHPDIPSAITGTTTATNTMDANICDMSLIYQSVCDNMVAAKVKQKSSMDTHLI